MLEVNNRFTVEHPQRCGFIATDAALPAESAVVPQEVRRMMREFDSRTRHYEDVL